MEKSLKSVAINYGMYLGAILSLLTVIGYGVSLDLFTQVWFGITFIILVIVVGILSVVQSKKLLGGFISFKNAFTSYFITLLVGAIISALINIIIFNVIDPDASIVLHEKIIESQVERLQSYNVPAEAIAETVEKMEAQGNMYSVGNILQSIIWQLAGFSVIGLIVAAAMKKNPPSSE
ncbi:hypothetical protein APS56_15210 [Pseudalgibacter alginicilyticus]|uniref:DUF4199 domain-containing protein n=1 Tax=Pseudalgibacter alginicilyticus TaxID=1736674 RepID=A0A0P0CPL3_9FLAO|nr:DUF4199 domain-containing protein [Pseudalgibacter alginicilyticus]ALJ06400.1 hypothetical protein APS56_15210 [Pseudalgibacter alginicilyticus]